MNAFYSKKLEIKKERLQQRSGSSGNDFYNLPDSTRPNPEIIVKMMNALVNIHTASPAPFMLTRLLELSLKTEEFVGVSIIGSQ